MSMRKEQRMSLEMPVRVSGMDANGRLFAQDVNTIDVTTTGARLAGIEYPLHRGCIVKVRRGSSEARFRVMWVGDEGGPDHGHIGVQLIDSGKFIWGLVIPRIFGDHFRGVDRQAAAAYDFSAIPSQAILNADPGAFD